MFNVLFAIALCLSPFVAVFAYERDEKRPNSKRKECSE